jgi:cyclopropane-fatty-acyl-phospholipid synthase
MISLALPQTTTVRAMPPFVTRLLNLWLGGWTGGRINVCLPGGLFLAFGNSAGPEVNVTIHHPRALWRVVTSGTLGWAEAYMAGEWDCSDLSNFLLIGARNLPALAERGGEGTVAARLFHRAMHLTRANTRAGSKRNIAAHYDLGNAFYRLWLDQSMTYSSAIFASKAEPLADAQTRKYRRLCDALQLKKGGHVLEIGCGWGGFAEVAARDYGCRVTAITVSEQQAAFARERIARLGLGGIVDVRLQDYRELNTQYDAIASVEMFEAVGQENWPAYFAALRRCLLPGGAAAVQTITIAEMKFESYRRRADFIQRYIFPGGFLPSPGAFRASAAEAGFLIEDEFFFGGDYAETLRRWSAAFNEAWPLIAQQGFDERFKRMWNYYLSYCEAGFETKHIDVAQVLLKRT